MNPKIPTKNFCLFLGSMDSRNFVKNVAKAKKPNLENQLQMCLFVCVYLITCVDETLTFEIG